MSKQEEQPFQEEEEEEEEEETDLDETYEPSDAGETPRGEEGEEEELGPDGEKKKVVNNSMTYLLIECNLTNTANFKASAYDLTIWHYNLVAITAFNLNVQWHIELIKHINCFSSDSLFIPTYITI